MTLQDNIKENICYSGGAEGADMAWGDEAAKAGHHVIHYMFGRHKNSNHKFSKILTPEELIKADPIMIAVNKVLKRSFPAHSEYVTNLIRRNYWQIRNTDSVYAIAGIDGTSVLGGTAWAVEAFKLTSHNPERLYVFDQEKKQWFKWSSEVGFPHWEEMIKLPPRPSDYWTGIGTRTLTAAGCKAIMDVFQPA